MSKVDEQIRQVTTAIEALKAQRSTLGDAAVDLALSALHKQIEDLKKPPTTDPKIKGERRQATILFSDLSGYTAMGEKLDPEQVQELMSRIKKESIRIVEHHEGSVNQFVGDEILALFGIPIAHEDDPIRAVKAALELHEMVRELSEEVQPLIGKALTMHSGINTGLIVTSVADDRDGKIGLTGDTVNTGARLLNLAKEDEILISPQTHSRVSPYFNTEALEPVNMKGKVEPMVLHRILGETKIQTRIEAAEHRGFTKYVGREVELTLLNSCLDKAISGEGQVVMISGEAGLGKSRLVHEFLKNVDREKIIVREARCQSYGVSSPYLPFMDALRTELGMSTEDSPTELHEKVVGSVSAMDSSLVPYIPVFLHLFSIPSEEYPLPEDLSGERLKQNIQEALVTLSVLNNQQLPKVWILEDWHWADEASDATFKNHLDVINSLKMMAIVLHRSEYSPELEQYDFHTAIDLAGIDESGVEAMIKVIYGVEQVPDEFTKNMLQHSAGNPFFIEELCLLFKDDETVIIENGKIILNKATNQIAFPQSVQAVVRTKLDRLYGESREVINLASVIGRDFVRPILGKITSRIEDLSNSLENLKSVELIRQLEHLPEVTYQFNHAITQEVTYQTLLIKRRNLLHRLIGETIEALYAERLEEQFEMLAYHFNKSSEHDKALYYLELAGDKAARNCSMLDARTYYSEAMDLIEVQLKTEKQHFETLKLRRIEISLKWARISHYAGPEEFIMVLETSLNYARALDNELKIGQLNYWFAQGNILTGNLDKASELFLQCIEVADKWKDNALLAQAYSAIGRVYFFRAEYPKANDFLEKGIPLLQELGEQNDVAYALGFLCGSYGFTGDIKKALTYGEDAVELAEETGNLSRKSNAYVWLGSAYMAQGNWAKAIEASNKTIEIAEPLGDWVLIITGSTLLGYCLFMNGSRDEGLLIMEQNVKIMEASKIYLLYPLLYGALTYCCAQSKSTEKSKDLANKCLEWSPRGWKGWECFAYYALALNEEESGASDQQVEETIGNGLKICEERGQRPYLAQGYFINALILLKRRNKKESVKSLNKATEIFNELKMIWWLEQAKGMEKTLA